MYKYGFPELPVEDIFPAPTWSAVDDHKMWCKQKKIGRVQPPEILRVDLVSFWTCSLLWRLQLNFKIAKSSNHGCNVEL